MGLENELTPRQIVEELDKYIIGQEEAKKAVAIALRNRARRKVLPPEMRDEVAPKNILMIGPTGVGKTEIARRLARLANAPFIKVEASKYTEIGYVGRDVESMVRDLTDLAVNMLRSHYSELVREKASKIVEDRLLDLLVPPLPLRTRRRKKDEGIDQEIELNRFEKAREKFRKDLRQMKLEDTIVTMQVQNRMLPIMEIFSPIGFEEIDLSFKEIFGGMLPKRTKERKVTIAEAREILMEEESEKLVDMDKVVSEAIEKVEDSGIIFLDEIDKIVGSDSKTGPDVSREGVQRDILPIVEGSTVATRYGMVRTDHILFIAAGAFHSSKPSDLIPELQGRFPIRVNLKSLGKEDFKRILTEPQNALVKQYTLLLGTENIKLEFTDDAIDEIASLACLVNEQTENIGVRRLHTIMERLLSEISFAGPEMANQTIRIDANYVKKQLADVIENRDLSRYIL
ncbi:TPA: ATP-dependent protease ATPase subunit HslU [Candidatus Poribacteria bacterium]|nr:ATP-dependent protease ATPase subunit HslU [Candidatus Poribacteria bacterium]